MMFIVKPTFSILKLGYFSSIFNEFNNRNCWGKKPSFYRHKVGFGLGPGLGPIEFDIIFNKAYQDYPCRVSVVLFYRDRQPFVL